MQNNIFSDGASFVRKWNLKIWWRCMNLVIPDWIRLYDYDDNDNGTLLYL